MDQILFQIADDWLYEQRTYTPEPEIMLIIALIEDAIQWATAPGVYTEESRQWIEAEPSEYVFCFESCCLSLHIAPEVARRRIMAMQGYHLPAPRPAPILVPTGKRPYHRRVVVEVQLSLL